MPRSAPSGADRELLDELAKAGVVVTPYQLEHWRHLGLLPRPTVWHRSGAGSSVEPHPATTFDAAHLLGKNSERGSATLDLTWELVYSRLPVTLECLRASTERAVLRPYRAVVRLWQEAVAGLPPSYILDRENLLLIADLVVELASHHRGFGSGLNLVRKEIRRANYLSDPDDIGRAARVAYGLRLVLLAGTQLSAELVRLARYGIEHPPAHKEIYFALPFDKLATARTVTHPEANLAVEWLDELADRNELLDAEYRDPLELLATVVALRRLNSPPWYDADRPLEPAAIEVWREDLLDLHERLGSDQDALPFDA